MAQSALAKDRFIHAFVKKVTEEKIAVVRKILLTKEYSIINSVYNVGH